MTERKRTLLKRLAFFPLVAIGATILYIQVSSKKGPQQTAVREKVYSARYIETKSQRMIPKAVGYGSVQPGRIFEAVAQVSGEIIEKHVDLKKGNLLKKGEVLIRIDPIDYKLAIAQGQSNMQSLHAQKMELETSRENVKTSIKIEKESLKIAERELYRLQELVKKKVATRQSLDQQHKILLQHKQSVQNLQNNINLIPAKLAALQAQLDVAKSQLRSAELNLERTEIKMPFDGRIATINIEKAQYAGKGQILLVIDSIDIAEIEARVPLAIMADLIQQDAIYDYESVLKQHSASNFLKAKVKLTVGELIIEWPATVTRMSDTIDPKTQTIGVIVEVPDPYRRTKAGARPPLVKNMFVEVELSGQPLENTIVIPRSALHDQHVYLVSVDNRLVKRSVSPGIFQADFVSIRSGIHAGARVVVSHLVPAIDGMLIKPLQDLDIQQNLAALGNGGSQ